MPVYVYKNKEYVINTDDQQEALSKIKKYLQETDYSILESIGQGAKNTLIGSGKMFGIADESTYRETLEDTERSAADNPIATGIGKGLGALAGVLPAFIPGVGPVAALTAGAVGSGIVGGSAREAEVLEKTGDADAARKAGLSEGLFTGAGVAIPGGFGSGLLKQVITGGLGNVALNEADIATQNKILEEHPELQGKNFDPSTMAVSALFGMAAGGVQHLANKAPKANTEPELTPDIPRASPKEEIYTSIVDHNEMLIKRSNARIEAIKQEIETKRFRTPEDAEAFKAKALADIETEKKVISLAEDNINTVRGVTKQEPTVEPEATTIKSNRLNDVNIVKTGDTMSKDGIASPRASGDVPEASIQTGKISDTVDIIYKHPEEFKLITNLVKTLGLENDNIKINLANDELDGLGKFYTTKDQININVNDAKIQERLEYLKNNEEIQTVFNTLDDVEQIRFAKAWVTGHELGHVAFIKTLQTEALKPKMYSLYKEFQDYVAKGSDKTLADPVGLHAIDANNRNLDHLNQFTEFFAQRVARETLFPKVDSPLGKIIKDIKKLYSSLLDAAGITKNKLGVDDFIRQIIEANDEAIKVAGKTLWEMNEAEQASKGLPKLDYLQAWNESKFSGMSKGSNSSTDMFSQTFDTNLNNIKKPIIRDQLDVIDDVLMNGHPDIAGVGSNVLMGMVKNVGLTFTNHFFGVIQKKSIWTKNPVIQHVSNVILWAKQMQVSRGMKLLNGLSNFNEFSNQVKTAWIPLAKQKADNSVSVVLDKTDDNTLFKVLKVFEKGFGYDYMETLAKHGKHLNPDEVVVYKSLATMWNNMFEMVRQTEARLGKSNIMPMSKGWYPASRHGKFSVSLHMGGIKTLMGKGVDGELLTSNAVYSQRFFTEAEANDFINNFNRLSEEERGGLQAAPIVKEAPVKDAESIEGFAQTLSNAVKNELELNGVDPKVIEDRVQEVLNRYYEKGGVLGFHHRYRTNLPGYIGSELFKSSEEAGKAFRKAVFTSVEEYTRALSKIEIKHYTDKVLNSAELQKAVPNTVESARFMRDYSINEISGLGKESEKVLRFESLNDWLNNVYVATYDYNPVKYLGASRYPTANVTDRVMGELSRFFYSHVLMSRPAFWVSQGLQFLWSARSIARAGGGPIASAKAFGEGIQQLLFHTDKEFMDGLFWASQNTQTFHPQFIHDLNSFHHVTFQREGHLGKFLMDWIMGEKPSTMSDTFSRLVSYAWMYKFHEGRGLKGKELWRQAAMDTDENMVQYGRSFKAPVFQELGTVGDLMSPLQTFSQAALGNFIADIKLMMDTPVGRGKLKAALPAITTSLVTMTMTGAIGGAMVAEYEALRLLFNKIASKLDVDITMPSLVDFALSGDTTLDRLISHGVPAWASMEATGGEGLDLLASNRWQPILGGVLMGEKDFIEMMPIINWAMDMGRHATTLALNNSGIKETDRASVREAAMGLVPGYWKGVVDAVGFDSLNRETTPNKFGHATTKETPMTNVARFMGTKTIEQATNQKRLVREKLAKKVEDEKVGNLKRLLVDSIVEGNRAKTKEIAYKLGTDYKMTSEELNAYIQNEMFRRKVPEGMRQFISKSGNMSNANKRNWIRHQEMYGEEE